MVVCGFSTTEDLILFETALLNGNIIDSTELAKMKTIDAASYDYGLGLDFYTITGIDYYGHYGEVANTSGMFFADVHSSLAPNGYYIAYNYNTQGVDMQNLLDVPVFQLLNTQFAVGIGQQNNPNNISITPMPAKDNCTIAINPNVNNLQLNIVDMQGSIVYTSVIKAQTYNIPLNVSLFNKGIYIVQLIGENTHYTQKLIVE